MHHITLQCNCFCYLNPTTVRNSTGLWIQAWVCAVTVMLQTTSFLWINVVLCSFKLYQNIIHQGFTLQKYSICGWKLDFTVRRQACNILLFQLDFSNYTWTISCAFLLFMPSFLFFIFHFYYQICESPLSMSVCLPPCEAHLKASWWLTAAENHKSDVQAEFLTPRWHSLCQPWNKDVAEQEVKACRIQPPHKATTT